ncbi:MAG TPA: flagellar basal body rod C-terminal domain-containing protein [Azospirillum sp.]|nr:flagellar basal body rod C-terminal domain-containing protein [Azospirillum sp.]
MNVALTTALSGLTAATRRLDASASNTANARTTGPMPADGKLASVQRTPPSGAPYVPVRAVDTAQATGGVRSALVSASPGLHAEYQPDSADANAQGLVAAPNVDVAQEVTQQIAAGATYKANAKVARTADEMLKSVLDMKA